MAGRTTAACLIAFGGAFFLLAVFAAKGAAAQAACGAPAIKEATLDEIRAHFKAQNKTVLTLLGYSAAGYENRAAMIEHATDLLTHANPTSTIINIGATPDGIGVVYELAKKMGFATTGIVSSQARDSHVALSSCVDTVFFVEDATWGGFVDGTQRLSPTSTAMVEVSDRLVAIGGGEVARDELTAARRAGRLVTFIPADMNHALAREAARKKGQPPPTDFRGAADAIFGKTGVESSR